MSSATHEKREIKNTSKFSTRTVVGKKLHHSSTIILILDPLNHIFSLPCRLIYLALRRQCLAVTFKEVSVRHPLHVHTIVTIIPIAIATDWCWNEATEKECHVAQEGMCIICELNLSPVYPFTVIIQCCYIQLPRLFVKLV